MAPYLNSYRFPTGPVGGWKELARTTLGGTNASIDVTSLANKRYYMVLTDLRYTASLTPYFRLDNVSTGTPYADRYSDNDGTDATTTSQNQILYEPARTTPTFGVGYLSNLASKEKLLINHTVNQSTAAATTPPL